MSEDDEAARRERAERLRKQIDRMLEPPGGGEGEEQSEDAAERPAPRSPRDFIHDKMREPEE
jgi:plasmid stabilization system protein ParE